MPLTPKDDVNESRVEQQTNQSENEALEELRQRVDDLDERTEIPYGLDTLDELAESHAARDKATEDLLGELEERVDELEDRVDRQEAVLYDLIYTVEVLGSAADRKEVAGAKERVEDNGSEAYPWRWNSETLDFKAERYE